MTVLLLALAAAAAAAATAQGGAPLPAGVVPLPASYLAAGGGGNLTLAGSFAFSASAAGQASPTLSAALVRFGALLGSASAAAPASPLLSGCAVTVSGASLALDLATDESYTLEVGGGGGGGQAAGGAARCAITAPTVYGAMHGLETFVQLVSRADRTVPACAVVDKPRFPFRATMIDTSRHYYPLEAILSHLDAMSAVKMNVLHWHIVDIESFPYVSVAFPQLAEHGAYHPTEVYTPACITRVVKYAKVGELPAFFRPSPPPRPAPATRSSAGAFGAPTFCWCCCLLHRSQRQAERLALLLLLQARGIRVIPEIDTPGNANAVLCF